MQPHLDLDLFVNVRRSAVADGGKNWIDRDHPADKESHHQQAQKRQG